MITNEQVEAPAEDSMAYNAQVDAYERGVGQQKLISWMMQNPWNSGIGWSDYLDAAIRALRPPAAPAGAQPVILTRASSVVEPYSVRRRSILRLIRKY